MMEEDTLYWGIRELGESLQKRAFSPVELTESYLERSERLGPALNAYATLTRDLALEQARAAEREISRGHYRGPLHGIPYAAKDLLAVRGYPTTWGARPFAKQVFDYNATVIERLTQAGAILIGKAAMIELVGGLGYSGGYASLTGPALWWRPLLPLSPWVPTLEARSSALRRIAASAVCAPAWAASAGTAPWRLPIRWTRSGPWRAPQTIAGSYFLLSQGTIQGITIPCQPPRPLSTTLHQLNRRRSLFASAG